MRKILKQTAAVMIIAAMIVTFIPVTNTDYAYADSGAYVPANIRWNFQSNDVCGGDLVYMGEFEQTLADSEDGAFEQYVAPKQGKGNGDNKWIVNVYGNEKTDDDYAFFSMMSYMILPIPKITFSNGMDHNLLNDTLKKYWEPYLFTDREYAVMEEGKETTSTQPYFAGAENVPDAYQTDTGNQGMKVYPASYINIIQQGGIYDSYKDEHESYHLLGNGYEYCQVPVRNFRNIRIKYEASYGESFYYNDHVICPKISFRDGSIKGGYYDITERYRLIRQGTPVYNPNSTTVYYISYTNYPQSFYQIVACCKMMNSRVLIRRAAGVDYSGPVGPDALQPVYKDTETHKWKLTVLEDDRHFQILDTGFDGKTFSFKYTGAKTSEESGDPEGISVVVDKAGKLWYGRIAEVDKTRTASFNLPFEYTSDCKIYVFNETNRDPYKTDFCSNVVELIPPAHITFDAQNGECSVSAQYAEGYFKTGKLPTPQRKGYIFTGWYESSDCSGTPITEDSMLDAGSEVTLYAGWKDCPTVTFDPCGGTVSPASAEVNESGKLASLPAPSKNGYEFIGWYTTSDTDNGEKVTADRVFTESATIYASWKKIDSGTSADPGASANRTEQMGTDGTAYGKGASYEAANKAITSAVIDNKDPKGTVFSALKLKQAKVTKNSIKVSWSKITGAKKYVVYANVCGKTKLQKVKTTTGKTYTLKKVNKKKLKKGTYYKFMVVALDKNNNVLSTSKIDHIATLGGKYTNAKSITTKAKKDKVTIKKGKTFKLAPKITMVSPKLKTKNHRKTAYETSNKKIATVSSKGVIKAKKKGTCYVYVYAQNGLYKKIKITVK